MVTKVFGSRSVSVEVFLRGDTWRYHIEQLRPRYDAQEDADPGEAQIPFMEPVPVPSLVDVLAPTRDAPATSILAAEEPNIPAKPMQTYSNPHLPNGTDYSREDPQ